MQIPSSLQETLTTNLRTHNTRASVLVCEHLKACGHGVYSEQNIPKETKTRGQLHTAPTSTGKYARTSKISITFAIHLWRLVCAFPSLS